VVKSHGGVDAYAFGWALDRAWEVGCHRLVDRVAEQLAAMNGDEPEQRNEEGEGAG
jgi:fatty acid/phospholipid biosynthesis enzyme